MKNQTVSTKYIIIVTSFLIPFFISCQNSNTEINDKIPKELHYYVNENNTIEFAFSFPDTVYRNKKYNGKILYRGIFDTINTQLATEKDTRFLLFYYTLTDDVSVENKGLDTVGALNNNTIPLYDIKFSNLGTHYINGFIEDEIYLDPNEDAEDEEITIISKKMYAIHKVIVVEEKDR